MIVTITLNPSVDYYINANESIKHDINRVEEYYFLPGGKGINVSIVLNNIGIESTAISFLGGFSGDFIISELKKKYPLIQVNNIAISDPTRVNVKIRDGQEMDINTCGPIISEENKIALLKEIEKVNKGDFVVISGSNPLGIDNKYILQIANIVNKKGANLILDLPKMDLETMINCKPFLIKPNISEFKTILNKELETIEEYIKESHILINKGIKNVLISMGEKGALYIKKEKYYVISHPILKTISTIGAGDSMLAAYVGSVEKGLSIEEALKMAGASGCATTQSIGLANNEQIIEMLKLIEIVEYK